MDRVNVALFPSAGSVHVFAAQDEGRFEAAGLDLQSRSPIRRPTVP